MELKQIIRERLRQIVLENEMTVNYMFFSNIQQIHRQCEMLLKMDKETLDSIIQNGHDWADDHVSEAKNNMDQVFDFFMNETKKEDNVNEAKNLSQQAAIAINMKKKGVEPKNESYGEIDESKNTPTNPKLWASSLAWAKSRYDVCPSAYCNGAAAKHYKSKGGGWKKTKK